MGADVAVRQLVASLRHRGPDAEGIWSSATSGVALGHTRLSILDLSSAAAQPMSDNGTGCVLVYNGEVFNFQELRSHLMGRGHAFRSSGDTEVILRLYVEYGIKMLGMLDGMFALAIWDPRDRTLLLARDRAGIKPLYVLKDPQRIMFASELKALAPFSSRQIDIGAAVATVRHLWCPGPRTALQGVEKIRPGTAVVYSDEAPSRTIEFVEQARFGVESARGSESERIQRLASIVRKSVASQLASDVPVGAFLSGGLDSTLVVAAAVEAAGPIPCFTMATSASGDGFADDLPFARVAARALGVHLHEVNVSAPGADDVARMVYSLDEPQADLAPLGVLAISGAARELGVEVLLSGAGGDDLFGGYRRHKALQYDALWNWYPPPARRALARVASHAPASHLAGRADRSAIS